MSESKANQCEFHLIKAWMPVSKPYLKASVKSITDLKISGLTENDVLYSITVLSEDQYLALVLNEMSDVQTVSKIDFRSMSLVEVFISYISISILARDTVVLTTEYNLDIQVYTDGQSIGKVDIVSRVQPCKSGYTIMNRWLQ